MPQVSTDYAADAFTAASNLVEVLQQRALVLGDKEAFRFVRGHGDEDRIITYRGLHERATAVAAHLQSMAAPGQRALLLFGPGLDFVVAFFGCLYAGIVAVPIAPPGRNRFTSSIEAIFDASSPVLILSTADACAHARRTYAHLPKLLAKPWVAADEIPDATGDAWRDPQIDATQTAFLQYTSGSTSSPKGVMLSHDNLLYNAECIQGAFGNAPHSSAVFWLPLYHDMGLIGGVIQPIYCGGACTLLAPAAFLQRPSLWLEMITRTRATVSGGPDFAFDLCARKVSPEEREGLDLSSWEVAFMGAERIRAQTMERFARAFESCGFRREAFFPCYGLAEATLMVSGGPRLVPPTVLYVDAGALARNRVQPAPQDDTRSRGLVGCGESLPRQEIVIVDPANARPCAADEVGEIWVRGPSVARGYHERPEATVAAFGGQLSGGQMDGDNGPAAEVAQTNGRAEDHVAVASGGSGPFLRTGDLGFLRDGKLFVTGRLKDLILIRGRNHYPEDIEHSVERAHDAFRAGYCAAFAVEVDERERLVIVQEIEPRRRDVDTAEALQAVRRTVAQRHDLEVYAIVLARAGAIPKTSSGKTRRSACREQYVSGKIDVLAQWTADREETVENWGGETAADPRNVSVGEIESWLTERIATRLGIPRAEVYPSTPFLEFGMGSIDAVEIAAELERWLCRRLSPTAIYNHPNIAALAQWLATPLPDPEAFDQTQAVPLPTAILNPEQMLDEVRAMTEQELEAFIREEMAKQERA